MEPIILSPDDYTERYGRAYDALCRALWAERYGIADNDPTPHTSDEARRVASAVFEAVGIMERADAPRSDGTALRAVPAMRDLWVFTSQLVIGGAPNVDAYGGDEQVRR